MDAADIAEYVAANANSKTQIVMCILVKRPEDEHWNLVVGDKHSDGVFRHVDMTLCNDSNDIDTALTALHRSSPEGWAEVERELNRQTKMRDDHKAMTALRVPANVN